MRQRHNGLEDSVQDFYNGGAVDSDAGDFRHCAYAAHAAAQGEYFLSARRFGNSVVQQVQQPVAHARIGHSHGNRAARRVA